MAFEPVPDYFSADSTYYEEQTRDFYAKPVRQPPHHYIPIAPPKRELLPAFDLDRGVNADVKKLSPTEHIKSIGVKVLPFGGPANAGTKNPGIVPPAQNNAYLLHLRNHQNFDTMKNLRSVNDCQICQMFLAAEGFQLGPEARPRPRLAPVEIAIPEEPNLEYVMPKPVLERPMVMPQQASPQPKSRQIKHVKDIFDPPIDYLQEDGGGEFKKIRIPAPDYGLPTPDYDPNYEPEVEFQKMHIAQPRPMTPEITEEKPVIEPKTEEPKTFDIRVIKDFRKRNDTELTVHKNEIVEILETNGKWSLARTSQGLSGFVPNKVLLF